MRRLTDEERRIVEENHDLIYWVANLKHLPLDEWYDLLAITLCESAMKHDPKKSKLSWYYKQRVDWKVSHHFTTQNYQKRIPQELIGDIHDEVHGDIPVEDELLELIDWIENQEHREVIKLVAMGYTQKEIGDELGISRSKVSLIMKEVREAYDRQAD